MRRIFLIIFCCLLSIATEAQQTAVLCPPKPPQIGKCEWGATEFKMYLTLKQAVEPNGSWIKSPFYARETMYGNPNINILDLPNTTWRDLLPEDGWVMVQKDFGEPGRFVNHAYMVLYNRFSGTLRLFILIGQEEASLFSKATITLTHPISAFRTANLDLFSGKGYCNPLTEIPFLTKPDGNGTVLGITAEATNDYFHDLPYWLYADFVMAYDPCVCSVATSSLMFRAQLLQESTMQFSLKGTFGQGNVTLGGNSQLMSWKRLIDVGQRFNDAAVSQQNSYKSAATGLIDFIIKSAKRQKPSLDTLSPISIENFRKWEHRENILNTITRLASGAGFLAGATSFLLSFASELDQPAQTTPVSYQLDLNAKGTITTKAPHAKGEFFLPGVNVLGATIRKYDNPMGTFTLLNTPTVEYGTEQPIIITGPTAPPNMLYYQMTEDIQYIVNPASHLKPNPELEAALVFEFSNKNKGYLDQEPLIGNLLVRESDSTVRTRYMHPEILKRVIVMFHQAEQNAAQRFGVPAVYVRVIAPLVVDTENYPYYKPKKLFFSGKYPVRLSGRFFSPFEYAFNEFNPKATTLSYAPYENITVGNNSDEITYINGTITKDKRVWGKISVIPLVNPSALRQSLLFFQPTNWSPLAGQEPNLNITASEEIDLYPLDIGPRQEILIPANVEFNIGAPTIFPLRRRTMPQSHEMASFICNSTQYKSRGYATKSPYEEASAEERNDTHFHLYPNPSRDVVNFVYEASGEYPAELAIFNLQGERVAQVFAQEIGEVGKHEIQYDVSKLPKGVYVCRLKVGSCIETKRLIIQ